MVVVWLQNDYSILFNQVIIKHTDGTPAALFLDAASINRSDITRELYNKNNITIVPNPTNTTAWLQTMGSISIWSS